MPLGPLMISLIERAGPVMMPLCAGWRRGPAEGAERLQHDGQTAPGRRQQMVYTAETKTRLFYRTSRGQVLSYQHSVLQMLST